MRLSGSGQMVLAALLATAAPLPLAGAAPAPERVFITEFMASNTRTLADRDRENSDWVELHNAGASEVNLEGWYLTDDRKDLKKWQFPGVRLAPSAYLLVFASGKDRRGANAELHTNFKLEAAGEYLALVKPDGTTIASQFAPAFPAQLPDASCGWAMSQTTATLVATNAPARVLVPTAEIGLDWTKVDFNDSGWMTARNGVGYDTGTNYPQLIRSDLLARMQGRNPSAYIRIPFTAPSTDLERLSLRLRYDDGFIAYLNGQEVARRNAPEAARWNSAATGALGRSPPVVLEENFDSDRGGYALNQVDPATRPRLSPSSPGSSGQYLRLVNGRVEDQVNSIAFRQMAAGSFEEVTAEFDFRYRGTGDGTDRLMFLLIPVAQHGSSGEGVNLTAFQQSKEPALPGVFSLVFRRQSQSGQNSLSIFWDRATRLTRNVPTGLFDQRLFHRVQLRLQPVENGALVTVSLIPDVQGPKRQVITPIRDALLAGLKPYEARVQLAARIGHWDTTVDLDNIKVHFTPAVGAGGEEFDLSGQVDLLRSGANVLAIHGLNNAADDGDFLLLAEMTGSRRTVRTQAPRYFATPTPRAENPEGLVGVSEPPVFSTPGGIFTKTVTLQLHAKSGTVRYTLDGTEPNATSEVYAEPLKIDSITLVKAKTFEPGRLPSATRVETYTMADETLANTKSALPLVILDTFGQYVYKGRRTPVSLRVIDAAHGKSSLLGEADFDGRAEINVRGNTSLRFPKKSYRVRLRDENGGDLKVSLLGLPKDEDWVLYAPYADKTLMRDVLAYELSAQMGHYAPRTRFVELYANRSGGRLSARDYQGVYVLIEKIKRDRQRVNIEELTPTDNAEPDITGGYIFKRDHSERYEPNFFTSRGVQFFYVEPDGNQITPQQRAWLTRYLNAFEDALYGPNFKDPQRGYAKYLDVESFIDQHLLIEMSKNIDGFRYSVFLTKDRGGKLKTEPVWDWNLSFGNADYYDAHNPNNWYYPRLREVEICWYRRLSEDPDFAQRVSDRWGELRTNLFSSARLLARVDEIAAQLKEAQARNFRRWPILGDRINPNWFVGETYDEEVKWMKEWIERRIAWMDRQFVAAPAVSPKEGKVERGAKLTLRSSSGRLFYTLDGSDPRMPGGGVSAKARRYEGPITLQETAKLFARSQQNGIWSSPATATFAISGSKDRAGD